MSIDQDVSLASYPRGMSAACKVESASLHVPHKLILNSFLFNHTLKPSITPGSHSEAQVIKHKAGFLAWWHFSL